LIQNKADILAVRVGFEPTGGVKESVSYRFFVAGSAISANAAVAHCPKLPKSENSPIRAACVGPFSSSTVEPAILRKGTVVQYGSSSCP